MWRYKHGRGAGLVMLWRKQHSLAHTGTLELIFIKYMTLLHMILKGVGDKNHKNEKSEKMPIWAKPDI